MLKQFVASLSEGNALVEAVMVYVNWPLVFLIKRLYEAPLENQLHMHT